MRTVDVSQQMTEDQRTQAFREFVAGQMQQQTKSLDTIRSLHILWTVLFVVVIVFALAGALAG